MASSNNTCNIDEHVHDLIIIGAGPCGLALAARLREHSPSSLFTDSEHQRYHWIRASQHSLRTAPLRRASRRAQTAHDRLLQGPALSAADAHHGDGTDHASSSASIDMAVLDAHSDGWMGAWNERFEDLGISHLRSPMFFHTDPADRDGLLAFAYRHGRENELREIKGVVGKGLSKHQRKKSVSGGGRGAGQETNFLDERDRPDYWRPSQQLFRDHCQDVVNRYGLGNMVQKCRVLKVRQVKSESTGEHDFFQLETSAGRKAARILVLAVSAASPPSIPKNGPFGRYSSDIASMSHVFDHSSCNCRLPESVMARIKAKKPTNIVVIGGGLTSAQVVDAALRAGVTRVFHLMRGPFKVKHFDLDLPWIGKYKNFHLASFWSADNDEDRWEMAQKARNGGSITPEYKKILLNHVASGRLQIGEHHIVSHAEWNASKQQWYLETEPQMVDMPDVDHVFFATGMQADFTSIDMLQPLLADAAHAIETVGGLPCLTNDLMWNDQVPMFFTGRLAALRLGPGAANLEGARQGAERIAWKIGDLLEMRRETDEEPAQIDPKHEAFTHKIDSRRIGLGITNQFALLSMMEVEQVA